MTRPGQTIRHYLHLRPPNNSLIMQSYFLSVLTLASGGRVALAGTLLLIGGAWTILSITIAESLTPGYSVSKETISGLGSPIFSGTCIDVPSCVTPIQPASAIFVRDIHRYSQPTLSQTACTAVQSRTSQQKKSPVIVSFRPKRGQSFS